MKQGYKFSWDEMEVLRQNWESFANENLGDFVMTNVQSSAKSGELGLMQFKLLIPYLGAKIIFLTTECKPLKISYLFKNKNYSEFLIYPEDFTDRIAKLFGLKEIETGDTEFDKNFFIKGNDVTFVNKLLSKELKSFLLKNNIANFKLEKTGADTVLELNAVVNELDINNLRMIVQLFKDCISAIEKNSPKDLDK